MLTIGQVAKAANVNIETIRYYQRRGLVQEPRKPLGGHRHYSEQDISRLSFIKNAQGLGFTLDEIKKLLQFKDSDCCGNVHELALQKIALIDSKLAALESMRQTLANLAMQCELKSFQEICPLIQSLLQNVF